MAEPSIALLLFVSYLLLESVSAQSGIISGQGKWRYEYMPDRVPLPAAVSVLNGHGLCKDHLGNIYFTFQPTNVTTDTQCLIRFAPDGTEPQLIGDPQLSQGVPHGLKIGYEPSGTPYLLHANNAAIITKTDLNGRILWRTNQTSSWLNTQYWPFKPTDAIPILPTSDAVFVTDGYGSAYIHDFSLATGRYTNHTFGGKGHADNPPKFNTPHGINFDPRHNMTVISDRANNRLVWVDEKGNFQRQLPLGVDLSLPCNVDFGLDNEHALVTNLGSYKQAGKASNGTVGILDANDNVVSVIEVAKLLGDRGHMHPHDAIFLDNDDIVICCWSPGTLSYWRRLPHAQ
eukprot:TRINITY_DN12315_c0_g3_i1.p2 TRINITY_DN12315_c0_g3~~TRINITY_DN12315_c0_g3_i1.p2  ORF type:complete len:344 (+),score=47.72 TRINITY_DN12315_c0_g3_i1:2142-3173(+)